MVCAAFDGDRPSRSPGSTILAVPDARLQQTGESIRTLSELRRQANNSRARGYPRALALCDVGGAD